MLCAIMHHEADSPCFECQVYDEGERLHRFIKDPPEWGWVIAREKMMRPTMERIVAEAGRVLPLAWMRVLPTMDTGTLRGAEVFYYEACKMLVETGTKPDVRRLYFLLQTIVVDFLKLDEDTTASLLTQLSELKGRNKVFNDTMESVEWDVMGYVPSQKDLGHWLRIVGAEDYGQRLLYHIHVNVQLCTDQLMARTRKRTRELADMNARLVALRKDALAQGSVQRRLAIAMALHPRLGAGSLVHALDPGIVAMCAAFSEPAPLLRWTDFLRLA